MPYWLEEFLIVLAFSKRTQWAILLGVVGFISILLVGAYFVNQMNFPEMVVPSAGLITCLILQRYEGAVWGVLFSSVLLAVRCYIKDRERLLM